MTQQEIIKKLEKLNNVTDNRDELYYMFAEEFGLKVVYKKGLGTSKVLRDENGKGGTDMQATKNKETGKYMVKVAWFNYEWIGKEINKEYTEYKLTKKGYKVEQPFK